MASPIDRTQSRHSTYNSLGNQPHDPRAGQPGPVVLFDPDLDRAQHVLSVLCAGGLDVRHEAQFEHLVGSVQEEEPVAVVVPWPVAAPSARSRDLDLLEWMRTRGRQTVFLAYAHTSRLPISDYCRPLAAGARQVLCLQSPTFAEDLRDTLIHLIGEHQERLHEEHGLRDLFARHGLVGRSSALQEIFRRALRASHFNDLPVMILGETGTGKQRLAEAIHAIDPRRADKPFLTLNCSAIHKSLAESTLFGHARGAFSGSTGDRLGVFRAAHGGTLLLDEIGELDLELQPKLLRVLQEHRVVPVGEDYEHPVDVRIITATNRPLPDMVREGRFREDLFQRLHVFQIRIPPLRERPHDIQDQARHFLDKYGPERQPAVTDLHPRLVEALRHLPWEGNSRQLENTIRQMVAHKERGQCLVPSDLPAWALDALAAPAVPTVESEGAAEATAQPEGSTLPFTEAIEAYERRLLAAALARYEGNRTQAAAALGLSPRTIFNKIRKYKLA